MILRVDVQKLLERIDAQNIQKRGHEMWACCPFPDHPEQEPSFQIRDDESSQKHGWFSCHGCGRSGGAIGLVASLYGLDSDGAKAWLLDGAAMADMPVFSNVESTRFYGPPFRLPAEVRIEPFGEWPPEPRVYLASRGVTSEQVERWGIGFATAGRLARRVVVVKRDSTGRPRAYSARAYSKSERRYIEPARTENPDETCIFGEQFWPRTVDREAVVVCEGAFDALAVERVSSFPVAAISGSDAMLSLSKLAKLGTFKEIIVATDGDRAGEKVAGSIAARLSRHCVRRAALPPDLDANDLERKDPDALRAILCA